MKCFLLFIVVVPCYLFSQAGSLDNTFGNDGIVLTDLASSLEFEEFHVKSVLTDNNNEIYVTGYIEKENNDTDIFIIKYNEAGELDSEFGNNGIRLYNLGEIREQINFAALQQNGKIVLVGRQSGEFTSYCMVMKINSDGSLDDSFANNGIFLTESQTGVSVAMDSQNNYYVLGFSAENDYKYFTFKLNESGELDEDFGDMGYKVITVGDYDYPVEIKLFNDHVFLYGESEFDSFTENLYFAPVLIKLNLDGSFDEDFGVEGIVVKPIDQVSQFVATSMEINETGSIFISGMPILQNKYDFYVASFNQDGSVNANFGVEGAVVIDINSSHDMGWDLLLHEQSPILAGHTTLDSVSDFTLLKFDLNGNLSENFGENGIVKTDLNNNSIDWARFSTLYQMNKAIVAGTSDEKIGIVRYWITNPLEVEDISIESKVQIAPNPTSNSFVINGLSQAQNKVEILDLTGKIIQEFKSVQNNQTLNLGAITKGTYIIKINSNDKTETKKLIVK